MKSVNDVINEIIKDYPFLEKALSEKIINLSALARKLKPEVEKRILKSTKEGAIVMALKRAQKKFQNEDKEKERFLNILDLTLRSNLSVLTFANSQSLFKKMEILQKIKKEKKDTICIFSEGVRETTFLINFEIQKEIEKIFKDEKLIFKKDNLSAITLRFSPKVVFQSGIFYQILKRLSFENINIIELFSTTTELTILIDDTQINKAFFVLKKLTEVRHLQI